MDFARDVRRFGAKGDDSTDDTAKIQAAIDSLTTGGTVVFPPGEYKITSTLTVPASPYGISLVGAGSRNASKIIWGNATPGTALNLSQGKQAVVRDLAIYGTALDSVASAQPFAIGILASNYANGWKVSNVWIYNNNTGVGIQAGLDTDTIQASEGVIEFCNIGQIGTGVYIANANAQNIWIHDNIISYWTKGIHNRNGNFIAYGNTLAANAGATAGLYIDGAYAQIQFFGNTIDAGATKILQATSGAQNGGYVLANNTLSYSAQTTAVDDASTDGRAIWTGNYFGLGGATNFNFAVRPKFWAGNHLNGNITLQIAGVSQVAKSDAHWLEALKLNTTNPGSRQLAVKGIIGVTDSNDAEAGYINPGTTATEFTAAGSRKWQGYSNSKLMEWDGTTGSGVFQIPGVANVLIGTAIPAGGAKAYGLSSTTTFGIYFGSGAPTVSAAKGSLYLRSDGSGTNDRMYVNTDGGTTWTYVTTGS